MNLFQHQSEEMFSSSEFSRPSHVMSYVIANDVFGEAMVANAAEEEEAAKEQLAQAIPMK
jgi:hypothetical protein